MSWQDEEDDRIDAEIAAAGECQECGVPIGQGWCEGCIAASIVDDYYRDDPEWWASDECDWP